MDLTIVSFQKLQERSDGQSRTIASLEERCISLKTTIDQLNLSLEKVTTAEAELKSEISYLHRSAMESSAHSHSDNEKIKQVKQTKLIPLL